MRRDPGQEDGVRGLGKDDEAEPLRSPARTLFPTVPTGYEALAEAPCPTALPPQPPEDMVSSGPEDCSFFPNGPFDHCLSHIPSIYTDT